MTSNRPDGEEQLSIGLAAASTLGRSMDRKADRGDVYKIALVCAFAVSLLMGGFAIFVATGAAQEASRVSAAQEASRAANEENRQRAEQAYAIATQVNQELQRRGQAPVPIPAPSGNSDGTVIAAAAAKVLAALPPQAGRAPTAEEIGRAVANYLAINPPGPTASQIASAVSSYLRDNPVAAGSPGARGEKGEPGADGGKGEPGADGKPGPAPTQAEIVAAFEQAAAANPSLLCGGKGQFTLVKGIVRLDGQPIDGWLCIPPGAAPGGARSGGK